MIFVGLTITLFIFILVFGGISNGAPPIPKSNPAGLTPAEEEEYVIESPEGAGLQHRFLKQCYLIDKIVEIAASSAKRRETQVFKNLTLVTGDLPKINGNLLGKKDVKPLFELNEKQIAGLYPTIKLYKSVGSGKKLKWVEIGFSKSARINRSNPFAEVSTDVKKPKGWDKKAKGPWEESEEEFAEQQASRDTIFSGFAGTGGGIKSFSYTLAGTNPEESEKVITAKLELWFQSLADLFRRVNGSSPADLIKYTDVKDDHDKYSYKKFKFKAVVGWATPPDVPLYNNPPSLRKALKSNKTSLYLQLVNHELNIKQDGTVSLNIEFIAAPEAEFNRPLLNILWSPADTRIRQLRREIKGAKGSRTKLKKLETQLRRIRERLNPEGAEGKAITKLYEEGKVGLGRKHASDRRIIETFYEELVGELGKADKAAMRYHGYLDTAQVTRRDKLLTELNAKIDEIGRGLNRSDHAEAGHQLLVARHQGALRSIQDYGISGTTESLLVRLNVSETDLLSGPGGYRGVNVIDLLETEIAHVATQRADADKNRDQFVSKLRKYSQKQRVARYNLFMLTLVEWKRIRAIDASPLVLGVTANGVFVTKAAIEEREAAEKKSKAKPMGYVDLLGKAMPVQDVNWNFYQLVMDQINTAAKDDVNKGVVGDVSLDQAFDFKKASQEPTTSIKFVTLGDIIDVAIGLAISNPEVKREKVMETHGVVLGPITIVKENKKGTAVKKYIVNMAHLPVSLDYFLLWYQQNVILPQKEVFTLKKFILAVTNDLVRKCLGEGCFNASAQDVDIKAAHFQQTERNISLRRGRCQLHHLKGAKPVPDRVNVAGLQHYLYFYSLEKSPGVDETKRIMNFGNGIYHFEAGARRGLLKNITFAKQDIPGLREARITGDTDNKEGYLREKYDVNIGMVGNTLFYPGQYVYVNPRLPGASRKQAEALGMGGVHFVHEVFHVVEDKYYQTEIKAIWQAFSTPKVGGIPAKIIVGAAGDCGASSAAAAQVGVTSEIKKFDAATTSIAVKVDTSRRQRVLDFFANFSWAARR